MEPKRITEILQLSLPEIVQYGPSSSFVFLLLPKDLTIIFFAITAAGVVPCGGPKKSPRTSSIVQIIFFFWSFGISEYI